MNIMVFIKLPKTGNSPHTPNQFTTTLIKYEHTRLELTLVMASYSRTPYAAAETLAGSDPVMTRRGRRLKTKTCYHRI